jgi:hypothetical protein
VGLHRAGEDGRFLWLPPLRELCGTYPVAQICSTSHIDRVCTLDEADLAPETLVDLGEWMRRVPRNGTLTLFEEQNHGWHILSKDRIKNLSN